MKNIYVDGGKLARNDRKTAIFVITFEPNKIQIRLGPQNDRLNLSFVKDNDQKWS